MNKKFLKSIFFVLGILANLKSGRFIVYLFILHKVLININIVANKFQEKTATLGQSKNIIQGVMMTFKNLKTTEYFSQLWSEIETFAKDHGHINTNTI